MQADSIFFENSSEVEVFESCYKTQLPLLLKGPTGCGKSQLVEFMSKKMEKSVVKVSCNEDTNAADLFGRYILKGGETVWQDGPVTRAVRIGAILYLDEIAEAREDVIVAIHPLTDHRREIYLDKLNEVVKAGSNFMLVASFNPGYQQGLKELKPSTRQRFVSISMNYLPPEKEANLLHKLTGIDLAMAKNLSLFAKKMRGMSELILKETISTRLLVNASQLIVQGMNIRKAGHYAIAEPLTDDLETLQALKDLIDLNL